MLRDMSFAEDMAQEALLEALEHWPSTGIPDNPGAWLMTVAKRRAIDHLRRDRRLGQKVQELGHDLQFHENDVLDFDAIDDPIGDDLLRLIFMCCHPILSAEARVALTLRVFGGLTTEEIARAFLVSVPTVAQRIVRAKRALSDAQVPFDIPHQEELTTRLASVLEVIYLMFNEGYSATSGDDWVRPPLCEEALRLGRILTELLPNEPEAHGLVALMEFQASRLRARMTPEGVPVLLLDQDRTRWDRLLIRRGGTALARAESLAAVQGPYVLQAAIAACHALARTPDETDWKRIATLYGELVQMTRSPIVELNRAVALAMAFGPEIGLEIVDELDSIGALNNYHLLPSIRGDLLYKLERFEQAKAEFERAALMTKNARERDLLLQRAATCVAEARSRK